MNSGDSAVGDYEYELRRGDAVLATGRLQLDEQPSPGDMLSLGRREVRVDDVIAARPLTPADPLATRS